jgi:hypothetical protein
LPVQFGPLCEKEAPPKTFFSVRHTFFDLDFARFDAPEAVEMLFDGQGRRRAPTPKPPAARRNSGVTARSPSEKASSSQQLAA